MDEEPDKNAESEPAKPVIPPPVFKRPPPPPTSPLEVLPKATPNPSPAAGGNAAARVKLGGVLTEDDADTPASRIALFNTRVTAAVIDILLAMGIVIGLVLILPGFADRLAWLVGIAYLVTRDSLPFLGGQSVGKKAMKIRTVTLDGKSLAGNWNAGVIRNGALFIPLFGLVELFILLTREDKPERGHRLGDEWAKTEVINEPPPPAPEQAG